MTVLSVPSFGGGVVKEGSADSQRTDELLACDAFDIGPRGQLVASTDVTAFAQALSAVATPLSPIFGLEVAAHPKNPIIFFIGSDGTQPVYASLTPDGFQEGGPFPGAPVDPTAGLIVTFASFPFVSAAGVQLRVILITASSRSFQYPRSGFGMYVITYNPSAPSYTFLPIDEYDALGTGNSGEFPGGTRAQQLAGRGVVAYNNHAFIWGFDFRDSGGDGPNRLMFSNLGNPLKWGLDPDEQAIADGDPETDRAFEDSDAVEVGGSGEAVRCCYPWRGKLWIGTNKELHWLEGFGRESFKTNGTLPLRKSRNVIGPKAMIEGPDGLLYGVSDEGLWRCDTAAVEGVGDKLRDYDGMSRDWWDLIWSDPARTLLSYPGVTNQDLVWMLTRRTENQVWVVIPYCNATAGSGYGTDTVIIKYHTKTGGFTRQTFIGTAFTAGGQLTRESLAAAQTYLGDSINAASNVVWYGHRATLVSTPRMPSVLPDVTLGPYAPFGPDGVGVHGRKYLTLSWVSGALPLSFALILTIDGQSRPTMGLTIGPSVPLSFGNGDIWVDTSGSDTSLGNANSGSIVSANAGDYLIKSYVYSWGKWVVIGGGQQARRVTIPIAFAGDQRGSRYELRVACTSAVGRFQLEQFGDAPSLIREGV